jgi:hypothetical protein
MKENEFEKQVRHKLDAFQLQPGDAIWQKLQLEFAKGKERKRKYVILSFLLVTLLGSALMLNDLKQLTGATNKIIENKTVEKLLQEGAANNLQSPPQPKEKPTQPVSFTSNNFTGKKKQQQNIIALTDNKISDDKITGKTRGIIKVKVISTIIGEDTNTLNKDVTAEKEKSGFTDRIVTNKIKPNISADDAVKVNEHDIFDKAQSGNKNTAVENKINQTDQADTLITASLNTAIVKEIKEQIKANQTGQKKEIKKLWTTSLSMAAGWSSTGNKYLNKNRAVNFDNSGTQSIPNGSNYYQPSSTKAGISFSAAFEVSRPLLAKTYLSIGLQYQLLTTSISTGDKDTAQLSSGEVNKSLFKAGSNNRYTSIYHFISIPVSFSTQIATIKKREINLTAGVNISRLIHTNALQFDNVQNSYYRNNSIFNKTQVGFSAAFVINLAGKNKAPFYIGPDFYYSLTPQAATGMYTDSHYKSFGIQLKKVLQKNRQVAATHSQK